MTRKGALEKAQQALNKAYDVAATNNTQAQAFVLIADRWIVLSRELAELDKESKPD